ncbi:MAG: hypothetical protein ACTSPI_14240 [Candidatus Heimdallarchaeaceae archaeon]
MNRNILLDSSKIDCLAENICIIEDMWDTAIHFECDNDGRLSKYEIKQFLKKLYRYNRIEYHKNDTGKVLNVFNTNVPYDSKLCKVEVLKALETILINMNLQYADMDDIDLLKVLISDLRENIVENMQEYQRMVWN